MRLNEAAMLQAGKYLLSCLTGAIDKAMEANYGSEWFAFFKDRELNEELPIIRDEECVKDMDLQACLKFFKFRQEYREKVLLFYGFYDYGTKSEKAERKRIFIDAVKRLIADFRNRYMHLKASTVEKESETAPGDDIYKTEAAVEDMKTVAQNFISVKDADGVSYYDRICECADRFKKEKNLAKYSVTDELSLKDMRRFSENDFIRACGELNISVDESETDGGFFFYSSDIEEDRRRIKKRMVLDTEERAAGGRKKAVITGISVAAAAAVTAVIVTAAGGARSADSGTGVTASVYSPEAVTFAKGFSEDETGRLLSEMIKRSASVGGSYEDFKELIAESYKNAQNEKYIESEYNSGFLEKASACSDHLIIPVTDTDGAQGISAVYYSKADDPGYITARTYTFVHEDGVLKNDLKKVNLVTDCTDVYPAGYKEAAAEKRFVWRDKSFKDDYTFLSEELVYDGIFAVQPRIAWVNADGSLSLMIRVANGTGEPKTYNDMDIRLTGAEGAQIYDGSIDLRQKGQPVVTESGRGVNYIVNIKQGSLAAGAEALDREEFKAEAVVSGVV